MGWRRGYLYLFFLTGCICIKILEFELTKQAIKELEQGFNSKLIEIASSCDEEIAIIPITSYLSFFSNNPITEPVQVMVERGSKIKVNRGGKLFFGGG